MDLVAVFRTSAVRLGNASVACAIQSDEVCRPHAVASIAAKCPPAVTRETCIRPGAAPTTSSMEEEVQSVLAQATNECTTALQSGGGTWERQSPVRSVSGLSPDDTEPPHEKNPPRSTSVPNAHIKGSESFDWSRRRSLPQEDVLARDRANSFGRKTDSKLSKISRSLSWNTRRLHRGQHGSFDEDNNVSNHPGVPGPAVRAPAAARILTEMAFFIVYR